MHFEVSKFIFVSSTNFAEIQEFVAALFCEESVMSAPLQYVFFLPVSVLQRSKI